jgi:hypothetical protein
MIVSAVGGRFSGGAYGFYEAITGEDSSIAEAGLFVVHGKDEIGIAEEQRWHFWPPMVLFPIYNPDAEPGQNHCSRDKGEPLFEVKALVFSGHD